MVFGCYYNGGFFVSRSAVIKNSDVFYKLGFFKGCSGIFNISTCFFKVRFLVSFVDSKLTLMNFRLIRGFGSQFLSLIFTFYKNQFGLKNDKQIFNYFVSSCFNMGPSSYFLIYTPMSTIGKCISVGFLGKEFLYFRTLISDIFSFLGPDAYDGLYLDYFDFKSTFSVDIAFSGIKGFRSIFGIRRPSALESFTYIRNLLTFFKILDFGDNVARVLHYIHIINKYVKIELVDESCTYTGK